MKIKSNMFSNIVFPRVSRLLAAILNIKVSPPVLLQWTRKHECTKTVTTTLRKFYHLKQKQRKFKGKWKQGGVFTSCYTTFKILIGKLSGLFPVEDQFSGFCATFDNCWYYSLLILITQLLITKHLLMVNSLEQV